MSEAADHPQVNPVEAALKSLQPAPATINRDEVMFRAGKAAAQRTARRWATATVAMTMAAAGLGLALVLYAPTPRERIVYVQAPQAAHTADRDAPPAAKNRGQFPVAVASGEALSSPFNYAHLRDQVARHGIDAMPEAPPVSRKAPSPIGASVQDWLKGEGSKSPKEF